MGSGSFVPKDDNYETCVLYGNCHFERSEESISYRYKIAEVV